MAFMVSGPFTKCLKFFQKGPSVHVMFNELMDLLKNIMKRFLRYEEIDGKGLCFLLMSMENLKLVVKLSTGKIMPI